MTNLDEQRQAKVDQVAAAARSVAIVSDDLRRVALEAINYGVPVTQVARAAGVHRATIYLWQKDRQR